MIEKRPLKYLLGNPLTEFLIPKCGFKVLKSLSISRALIRISTAMESQFDKQKVCY